MNAFMKTETKNTIEHLFAKYKHILEVSICCFQIFLSSLKISASLLLIIPIKNNTELKKAYLYASRLKDRSYPILCESGIASCTDSHQLYMDIEEWLSAQKERELRTESKDITDKQKIVNHGFDTRESFRKIK